MLDSLFFVFSRRPGPGPPSFLVWKWVNLPSPGHVPFFDYYSLTFSNNINIPFFPREGWSLFFAPPLMIGLSFLPLPPRPPGCHPFFPSFFVPTSPVLDSVLLISRFSPVLAGFFHLLSARFYIAMFPLASFWCLLARQSFGGHKGDSYLRSSCSLGSPLFWPGV